MTTKRPPSSPHLSVARRQSLASGREVPPHGLPRSHSELSQKKLSFFRAKHNIRCKASLESHGFSCASGELPLGEGSAFLTVSVSVSVEPPARGAMQPAVPRETCCVRPVGPQAASISLDIIPSLYDVIGLGAETRKEAQPKRGNAVFPASATAPTEAGEQQTEDSASGSGVGGPGGSFLSPRG